HSRKERVERNRLKRAQRDRPDQVLRRESRQKQQDRQEENEAGARQVGGSKPPQGPHQRAGEDREEDSVGVPGELDEIAKTSWPLSIGAQKAGRVDEHVGDDAGSPRRQRPQGPPQ